MSNLLERAAARSPLHVQALETKTIPAEAKCEETWGMLGNGTYLRCGKPAVSLVQHRGRDEGPYFMCMADGWHNCKNRNAALLVGEGALGDVKVEVA